MFRFLESEVDLDEAIKKLHAIAAAPELYAEFVKIEAHVSLLSLLNHENTGIILSLSHSLNRSRSLNFNPLILTIKSRYLTPFRFRYYC
jgi:hypothetical protein